ncbi:hypothetical protein JQX13_01540 [Archangium violaceum]|uniref:hypothetical protein n=1 Tax=Archangium violaceum TaxID=83451 RepID=UPI00193B8A37|nr:hypothetical protein [Archangium violaceum]QRK08883.1 hypothetical protein JQX13_01540 [Archangium violaceum]
MKKMFGMVALAAMALTGCGDVCDDLENAYDEVTEKYEPCRDAGEVTSIGIDQCSETMESCTDEDKESLSKMADCFRDMKTCSPAEEDKFEAALLGCALTNVANLSEPCEKAIAGVAEE